LHNSDVTYQDSHKKEQAMTRTEIEKMEAGREIDALGDK
jgi:hypothetical protein